MDDEGQLTDDSEGVMRYFRGIVIGRGVSSMSGDEVRREDMQEFRNLFRSIKTKRGNERDMTDFTSTEKYH